VGIIEQESSYFGSALALGGGLVFISHNPYHPVLHRKDEQLRSVFSLSPENELEFVKPAATLFFHVAANHFFTEASMNFFISAAIFPI
jgi:hypothetical protein